MHLGVQGQGLTTIDSRIGFDGKIEIFFDLLMIEWSVEMVPGSVGIHIIREVIV